MLALLLAASAGIPRVLGGVSALRRRDRLHLVLGFAGGALIGVALFETGPESFDLVDPRGLGVLALLGVGALGASLFALLERNLFGHVHTEDHACNPTAGRIGATGITVHAFLDGLAIGAAFRAGDSVGLLVSGAVLLHAFADGLNTVTVVLRHLRDRRTAIRWLAADVLAPIVGAAVGQVANPPDLVLGGLLMLFAGMFLFLGAGSLLPEAHRSGRDRRIVVLATFAGAALAFTAARVGG